MQVTINSSFLPFSDEACTMYCTIICILHRADNKNQAIDAIKNFRGDNYNLFVKYFSYYVDKEGMHFFQRRASDPNKVFEHELFTLS